MTYDPHEHFERLNSLAKLVAVDLEEQGYSAVEAIALAEMLDESLDWEQPNTVLLFCHLERPISEIEIRVLDAGQYARLFPDLPAIFKRKPGDETKFLLTHWPRHLGRVAFVPIEPLRERLSKVIEDGLQSIAKGETQ